jgi:hypothetical protein
VKHLIPLTNDDPSIKLILMTHLHSANLVCATVGACGSVSSPLVVNACMNLHCLRMSAPSDGTVARPNSTLLWSDEAADWLL